MVKSPFSMVKSPFSFRLHGAPGSEAQVVQQAGASQAPGGRGPGADSGAAAGSEERWEVS